MVLGTYVPVSVRAGTGKFPVFGLGTDVPVSLAGPKSRNCIMLGVGALVSGVQVWPELF